MQVLVVEDNAAALTQFTKGVSQAGHQAHTAGDGSSALAAMGKTRIDVVLAKRVLADSNGIELCGKIKSMDRHPAVHFILAVERDARLDLSQAMSGGADDVILVPFDPPELHAKLVLAERIIRLERELDQKHTVIQRNYQQTIQALAQLITTYSEQVGHHCRRVGALALLLAERHPQVQPEDLPLIEAAGLIHDIGLIGLPEVILTKRRTALTGDETVMFRTHSERGEAILAQFDLLKPLARMVRMHHEQFNGRGFPDGLSGDRIPVPAQIIAAASLYDDLIYRDKIGLKKAPEHLQRYRGYQLEPSLVESLLEINLLRLHEEAGRDYIPVMIADLAGGMTLATDILLKSGAFVMAAGTPLDASIIEKLKRHHESGNIMDKVFIRK